MSGTEKVLFQIMGDLEQLTTAVIQTVLECGMSVDHIRSGKDQVMETSFFVAVSSQEGRTPVPRVLELTLRERLKPYAVKRVGSNEWPVLAK